jgi:hypothetical protein
MFAAPANRTERLLVLVMNPARAEFDDFLEISREIQRLAPSIAIHILTSLDKPEAVPAHKWKWPALTIGIGTGLGNFIPARGGIMQAQTVKKLDQFERFKSLGIATPVTARLDEKQDYPEEVWGEFVVLKTLPLKLTSGGEDIRMMRTRRLARLCATGEIWSVLGNRTPRLVQAFVDTGRTPTSWRILTLLGRPLHCVKNMCPVLRPELDADDGEIESSIVATNHHNLPQPFVGSDMRSQEFEPEILEFAKRVSQAYPRIPLQGIDAVRDVNTGKLYALEINGGGNTWHFSSPRAAKSRAEGLTREIRISQFNAWKVAAEALIAAVTAEAS